MTDVSSVTAFNNFLSLYHHPSPWPPLLDSIPMPGLNAKVQRFEGWHYDAFAGVVPRRRVHGRDLEKTFSTPIVTFKSIDSIQPSDAHFPSLASTTPSISITVQEFSQHLSSYDVSLISDESSVNDTTDLSSSSTAFSLPTGVGLEKKAGFLSMRHPPPIDPADEESNSHSDNVPNDINEWKTPCHDHRKWLRTTLPIVTLSAFTETGQTESSIKVPKQRSYTGREPVISSSLADTPCATLGIEGVLGQLNATLGTSRTLDTPSLSSLLNECIEKNNDFGTAYARLRPVWDTHGSSNMQNELRRCEEKDKEKRQEALVGNQIIDPHLPPRRVWDLYSNRVVPSWISDASSVPQLMIITKPVPISHAWVDGKDRVDVWTSINGKEWPVPIPKGASLKLIRIEMLNLGVEYTWLDVLCLRQKGGPWEDLRVEEWKLDVPTIGHVYQRGTVVIYLSGLGQPLSLKDSDLDSDRSWFRRAWTVQEVGQYRIFAGDMPDGHMHAKTIDKHGNYETDMLTRFHKQLGLLKENNRRGLFGMLAEMQKRVSTNPVDRVAGLAFPLEPSTIPAYHESESLEDAWTALVDAMYPVSRADFLFVYPGAGLGCKKWRPTWMQIMTEPLPVHGSCPGSVQHDDETGEDWCEEPCIEKGLVRGLDVGSAKGWYRCGELVVKDADGIMHTFKIRTTHQCLIPQDVYTLLADDTYWTWAVGRRLPGQKFEKVSVFEMNGPGEARRLDDLHVSSWSHNVLV
ncbi:uncharacterized protein ARMOST_20823 [Armillaria ostoyae]|uniref:Heterokaryon incompatibility domain-containing protein n=1 Tax=Armillaria ostoyae TaxID=47428 RepID=A0A284S8H4_ARMOS|nr:uncharacterized protein ARMOST_20823 [Armillaria ostoyae]